MNHFLWLVPALLAPSVMVSAQTSQVMGTITDEYSPLPGAKVTIEGSDIVATTDFKGRFSLTQLAPGAYRLKVTYLGFEPQVKEINVNSQGLLQLGEITLLPQHSKMEVLQVRGAIQRGEMLALNSQKNSDTMINVISANEIGKLPDRNAAEAVQRIPGVSIERDQGEGRFVAVRGLPAQWNSATLNGNRIPTAEEETVSRATAFDFFPSDMIEFVEVTKALTPDQEGDAIGGNVNFITRKAATKQTFKFNAALGQHQQFDDGTDYSANALYGDRTEDGKLGFIVNANLWKRDWATDNYEPRRDSDAGIYRLELRDYTGTRETYGVSGAAQYELDNGKLYVSGMYGSLRDDELHYKHRYRFDKSRIELQHIRNELITEMTGFELGGEHYIGDASSLDWQLANYVNDFHYGNVPSADDASYFVVRFDQKNVAYQGLEDRGQGNNAYNLIDGGKDDGRWPSTHLDTNFRMDPASMKLSWVELYKVAVTERDNIVAQINFKHDLNESLRLKFGLKYRDKERDADFADEFYRWDETKGSVPVLADFTLSDQPGRKDYLADSGIDYQGQFSQVADPSALAAFWQQNKNNFILDQDESEMLSNGGGLGRNFDVAEQHISAYGMASWDINEQWFLLTGLRLTQTRTKVSGYNYIVDEKRLVAAKETKDYLSILPALHLKYSPNELTNWRLALTRSFSRPDFGALSPGASYSEADNELNSGNSQLEPTYSDNLDLLYEHFFEEVGVVSAGLFYKKIQDPIFMDTIIGDYKGKSGININQPKNGDDASLWGAELTLNHSFSFIHESLSNFGAMANYTWMDSSMSLPKRDDTSRIPRQAKQLYNVSLYFDNNEFSARMALNHKGDYIESHGKNASFDSYYGAYTSVDFSATYTITPRAQVYLEVNNLTDEPLKYFQGDKSRPLQVEYYGVSGMLGFSYGF
ncbi:MAG: TonB-dependent receptor [Shewanella sp.]|jgi:TonB-dependent receptor